MSVSFLAAAGAAAVAAVITAILVGRFARLPRPDQAAWACAADRNNGDEDKTRAFMTALFKNVSVLDTGARGATTTFARRGIGDALIAWENEAFLLEKEFGAKFDVVAPSLSILAEPAVTCVIPGTSRPQHLVDNLKAAVGRLPDAAMRDRMAAHIGTV